MNSMPLVEHLEELRKRILYMLFSFFFASLLSYPLTPFVLKKIKSDLLKEIPFIVLSPQEAILVYLKLSFLLGFILSFPVLIFQSWKFIAPGLLKKEKRLFLWILLSTLFLFLLGAAFAYFLLLPITLNFLIKTSYMVAQPMLSLNQTFTFIILIFLTFGVIFQLPLVVGILTKLKLIDHKLLSSKRRYIILLTFIIAAIITDPSMITQILVAIPIVILYEIGLFVSKFLS
jgi:sec-independent protein translocase protein TatC